MEMARARARAETKKRMLVEVVAAKRKLLGFVVSPLRIYAILHPTCSET